MGKSNIAVKQWLRNKFRFADLFNGTIFQGQQIVFPEDLEEIDSECSILVTDKNKKEKGVQKYRDIAMRWKKDIQLSILACENQNKVHYAMPVRMMLYDSLTYTEQIRQLWKNLSENETFTEEEFLSQFRKEDRLFPVISIVFYYGVTSWDASTDLYGMFQQNELFHSTQLVKKYIPNYTLNLIDASDVKQIELFRSDLQLIFGMLKYKAHKEGLQRYIKQNETYFKKLDRETYQAVRELLHSEKELKEVSRNEKGEMDMCKALEDLYKSGVDAGMAAGTQTGIQVLIRTYREFQVSETEILSRIQKEFSLKENEALEYLKN